MDDKITLAFKQNHTVNPGSRVSCPDLKYGEDWQYSHDLLVLTMTEPEWIEWARSFLNRQPYCGSFYHRVSNEILSYFGAERSPSEEASDE